MEFSDKLYFMELSGLKNSVYVGEERTGQACVLGDGEQGPETSRSSFICFCTQPMKGGIGTHPAPHLMSTGQEEIEMAKAGLRVHLLHGKWKG